MTETLNTFSAEFEPPERLLTAADLAELPSDLPTGPARYELDDGRLIIMAPTGDEHGAYESNLVAALKVQGQYAGHGKVRGGESGVILRKNPFRVVGADALFVSNSRLPLRHSPEGYLETIPDIVVEVRSKTDRPGRLRRKIGQYLQAGVREVWLADPATQTVAIHRPDAEPQVLGINDTLTAGGIIPGFSLPVADVFRD